MNITLSPENLNILFQALNTQWELTIDMIDCEDIEDLRNTQRIIDAVKKLNFNDAAIEMQNTLLQMTIDKLEAIKQEGLDI